MRSRVLLTLITVVLVPIPSRAELPALKISPNRRFLVTEKGQPFFYLGDTAWELFHRLDREEAEHYLKDRAGRGYTVIQAVVLAELDGLKDPNRYGHTPFQDNDPTKPSEACFEHVDRIVKRANELGLYIGMLPTWGDKVGPKGNWGVGPEIFNEANALTYGAWLGKRYRDKGIIWILGGDRNPDSPQRIAIWKAMARGLRQGDSGRNLITFHPGGGHGSSEWFHDASELDFNMWQTGHNTDLPTWDRISKDYQRTPIKPVLDGEPLYEDHPIGFNAKERGYSNAADVRKPAYWDVFAGACGHTYGNHSVWQMWEPKRKPVNGPIKTWKEALLAPGADQMRHLRALVESRPYLTRIPDQTLLASDPGAGAKRIQATRDEKGTYAFVYVPASRPFTVRLDKLSGGSVQAWWYDPRSGAATEIGTFARRGDRTFTPPQPGENADYVLVLDDAAAGYGPPGKGKTP